MLLKHIMQYTFDITLAAIVCVGAIGGVACDEFATPAELATPQILAIRGDPVAVAPGATTTLTLLVADENGVVADPDVVWETTPTETGAPALGTVAASGASQAIYTAPSQVAESPAIASVAVRVETAERELNAIKVIPVGDLPLRNPEIAGFTGGGEDLLGADSLTVAPGQTVPLEVDMGADMSENTTFAWYSTAGEIERYQSNPVELVVRDDPGEAWLFVVVRDGLGGVVWRAVPVTVMQ